MIKIGIDPGFVSGSIAIKAEGLSDHWTIKEFAKTPYFEIDKLFKLIKQASERNSEKIYCIIERQMVMPKQGAVSTAKQHQHYGTLIGIMLSVGIPYTEVISSKWMSVYSMKRDPSETKTQWKNRLKQRAKELEPDLNILNHNADAILITRIADKLFI